MKILLQKNKKKIIPYGKQSIYNDDVESVIKVLRSDYITQGPIIEKFENALKKNFIEDW